MKSGKVARVLRSAPNVTGAQMAGNKEIFDYQAIADSGMPLGYGDVHVISPKDTSDTKCQ